MKVGDEVVLVGNPVPIMVVKRVWPELGTVVVVWFNDNLDLQERELPVGVLVHYDEE